VDEVLTGIQNSMAGVDEETVTDLRNKSDRRTQITGKEIDEVDG
jgi:hypothetical protein